MTSKDQIQPKNPLAREILQSLAIKHYMGLTQEHENKLIEVIPQNLTRSLGVLGIVLHTFAVLPDITDLSWERLRKESYARIAAEQDPKDRLLKRLAVASWVSDETSYLAGQTLYEWALGDQHDMDNYKALHSLKEERQVRDLHKSDLSWISYTIHPLLAVMLNPEIESYYRNNGPRRDKASLLDAKARAREDVPEYFFHN